MQTLDDTVKGILPANPEVARETQELLDRKTKPRGSLGRLEELACRVAAMTGDPAPGLQRKCLVVMGADHGVAEEGVSAYPSEVTGQMMLNFAAGGAALNVLARHAEAEVVVVDMGVKTPLPEGAEVLARRVGDGTRNFTKGPAMSHDQAVAAIEIGIALARDLCDRGFGFIGIGDMGIGNTTASSALCSVLLGASVEDCTGRGTGVDDEGLARKISAVQRGIAVNRPRADDPLDVLAKLGGFEIAGLCGLVLGSARARVPVLLDGFIASVGGLLAARLAPAAADYLIASHQSVEKGHALVLHALDRRPLLDLGLRLGEGTGSALALSLVDASLKVLKEMATFDSAKVSDSGR